MRVVFAALLAVLCARPLIPESFERVELALLYFAAGAGPAPATTTWLDAVLAALAAAAFLLCPPRRSPAACFAGAGAALLAAAAVLSTAFAGDKVLAARGATNLVACALAGAALATLMREGWMPRLALAAVAASASTNALKCVLQRTGEFEEARQVWTEQRAALPDHGQSPYDPAAVALERRLHSNNAFGYLAHPNVAASCMALAAVVVAAGGLASLRGTPSRERAQACRTGGAGAVHTTRASAPDAARLLLAVALLALLVVGVVLTQSLGALVSLGGGLAAMTAVHCLRERVAARPLRAFAVLAAAYVALLAGGGAWGLLRGTLPHESLAFRWEYWTAAGAAYREAPLTGVGRLNFIDAYLRHKSPAATEEVRDPHNLWVSLLVELGPLGLVGGAFVIAACVLAALRARGAPEPGYSPAVSTLPNGESEPTRDLHEAGARWVPAAVAGGVLLVQALASGTRFLSPGIALLWAVELAGAWVVAFAASAWMLGAGGRTADVDRPSDAAGAARDLLVSGGVGALVAALLHALVDFALLTPGGLAAFTVTAAAAAGLRSERCDRGAQPAGGRAEAHSSLARAARKNGRIQPGASLRPRARHSPIRAIPAACALLTAALVILARSADRWDASLPRAAASQALAAARARSPGDSTRAGLLIGAQRDAEESLRRNPRAFATQPLLAAVHEALADDRAAAGDAPGERSALERSVEHWRRAVEGYPTNPRLRIRAGLALIRLAVLASDAGAAREARAHLNAALAIDDLRRPEVVVKLRPGERRAAERALSEADGD